MANLRSLRRCLKTSSWCKRSGIGIICCYVRKMALGAHSTACPPSAREKAHIASSKALCSRWTRASVDWTNLYRARASWTASCVRRRSPDGRGRKSRLQQASIHNLIRDGTGGILTDGSKQCGIWRPWISVTLILLHRYG